MNMCVKCLCGHMLIIFLITHLEMELLGDIYMYIYIHTYMYVHMYICIHTYVKQHYV